MQNRKAFISYSWTSEDHERWVIDLATELIESGVDVILDKWDLKEGQDKYHFMEKMVTDPAVDKVIVVSDREYARKADERAGGVGTESQIISREVYERVDQQKFVAVLTELDPDGKPYLPAFFKSRIYIDMSDETRRRENFEQLVRWIYDKPLYKKPALGTVPQYITSEDAIDLRTGSRFRYASDAIKAGKANATGALGDYLDAFVSNLEEFRIKGAPAQPIDELVLENVESFRRFRDEFIDIGLLVARYRDDEESYRAFFDFFEKLLRYNAEPGGESNTATLDNFHFITYELFLYFIEVLLKAKKFQWVKFFLVNEYYVPSGRRTDAGLQPFLSFQEYPTSLADRNKRLKLGRKTLLADVIKERATRNDITFPDLIEADVVLSAAAFIFYGRRIGTWDPHTAVFAERYGRPALFQRATSARYFEHVKNLFDVSSKEDFEKRLFERIDRQWLAYWEFGYRELLNIDRLASKP